MQADAKRRRVDDAGRQPPAALRTAVWTEGGGRVKLVWQCAAWQVAASGVLMPVQWAAPPPPPRHNGRVRELVVGGVEGWGRLRDDLRASFLLGLARMLPEDILRCIMACPVLTPGHRVRVGDFAFLNPAVGRLETLRRRKREAEKGLRVLVGSRLVGGREGGREGDEPPHPFVSPVGFRWHAAAAPPLLCI